MRFSGGDNGDGIGGARNDGAVVFCGLIVMFVAYPKYIDSSVPL